MINTLSPLATFLITISLLATPLLADPGKNNPGKGKNHAKHDNKERGIEDKKNKKSHPKKAHKNSDNWWQNVGSQVNKGRFAVPPGHRPPAGMCRLWYPDLPPGRQPHPEDCSKIWRDRTAYILYGDSGIDPRYDWKGAGEDPFLRDLPHTLLDVLLDRVQ